MKVIVIGGVAGGASAAARLRRLDEAAQIIILERGGYVSYANCGLPYYIGGEITEKEKLTLQTPQSFKARFNIDVRVNSEAVSINTAEKTVTVKDLESGKEYTESYDKLVLSPGAKPVMPPLEGIESSKIFTVRTVEDALKMRKYIEAEKPKTAAVIGGGFIGLEMAENLISCGAKVTLIEKLPQTMAALDYDMACEVTGILKTNGVDLRLETGVAAFKDAENGIIVALDNGETVTADLAIMAIGVAPDTKLAADAGLTLAEKNSIVVNENMQTSNPDIYAAGDAVQVINFVSGKKALIPLAGPANKQGRIIANNICGIKSKFAGSQGSSVLKLFDYTIAATGLNERACKDAGLDCEAVVLTSASHATYYPNPENMTVKVVFEKATGKILGGQIIGKDGADKRIDVLATAIRAHMTSADLTELDLAYAPPYSSAKDPVNMAAYVIENIRTGLVKQWHWQDVPEVQKRADAMLLDVRKPEEYAAGHIDGAVNIELDKLRESLDKLDKSKAIYINCHSGLRSYIACRILSQLGYECYNFSGGYRFYDIVCNVNKKHDDAPLQPCGIKVDATSAPAPAVKTEQASSQSGSVTVSADDIKRVKGQGFLHCKGTDDFNGRVITRNGKVTNKEMQCITDAAAKFGSGEVAMTTRLTVEVQHIPYSNIDAFQQYLKDAAGLVTGGTGSKVRPVVSCKGTTCQYGLIDTFALSDKIHDIFYTGYHDVSLPHKFKIAVGGCPNNCVKPNLNDIGIIGQRIPVLDKEKCRGCAKCAVEAACPIHTAKVVDGKLDFGADCNHCGRCIGKCPFGAVTEQMTGYKVYIGGRWGKKVEHGKALDVVLTTEQQALDMIEKAILLFREQGVSGERFADTVTRLGFENVQAQLLSDDLLKRKNAILGINVVGGATC